MSSAIEWPPPVATSRVPVSVLLSRAFPQKRDQRRGGLARVPAQEIESAVTMALRDHLDGDPGGEHSPLADRELIERHVERITTGAPDYQNSPPRQSDRSEYHRVIMDWGRCSNSKRCCELTLGGDSNECGELRSTP